MQSVRICDIPGRKMVSSEVGMFGDGKLERFMEWMDAQPRPIFPQDFLFWDADAAQPGFRWIFPCPGDTELPDGLTIIDFCGGLYAVATDIDQKTDKDALNRDVQRFLADNHLELDPARPEMGNILTSPEAEAILGYCQMDYYYPVRKKV